MATDVIKALGSKGTHAVGSINTINGHVETVNHGGEALAAIDNFTIVEIDGYSDETGKPLVKQLSDAANKGYLIASVEQRMIGESFSHFYNDIGDDVRLVVLKDNLRFQTSAYSKDAGVTAIAKGNVAHFDPATKKFIVSDAAAPATAYGTALEKFVVVGDESDTAGHFEVNTIRLAVSK